ncbi:MAG: DNA-binding protein [Eubacteriales bacterium]|nr:DNA-binding protein [Eubacteriales bacterium]
MQDYMTLTEVAEKWELSSRRARKLCEEGRIVGAVKFGRSWAVPVAAEKPADQRVKSGKYIKAVSKEK